MSDAIIAIAGILIVLGFALMILASWPGDDS